MPDGKPQKATIKHQGCEVEVTTPDTLQKPQKVS